MKSEYPPRHADQHLPDGSDPLPGFGDGIRFNYDNEGGFLYVRFNASLDIDTFPDPADSLSVGGDWGGVIEDASGDGLLIGSTVLLKLLSLGNMAIGADGSLFIRVGDDSSLEIINAGKTFTINDSASNPIVTWTG